MCGRYRCSIKIGDLIEEYNINVNEWNIDVFSPKDQIYPTQYSPILFNNEGNSIVKTMHWGLVPYWAKDKKYASKMINARSETLLEKPSFKNLVNNNRCIIVTNGYYEWKNEKNKKIPYLIHKNNNGFLAMGGLWDRWKSPNGEVIDSYTIITKSSIDKLKSIHHRMPLILDQHSTKSWLKKKDFIPDWINLDTQELKATQMTWD